jgi:signal transduction histidine kinase
VNDPDASAWRSRLSQRMEEIRRRLPDDEIVQEAASDLETALEELSATTEQLAQQSNELAAKQTEIAEERERWQRLFDFAPDAMVVTDDAGMIVELNGRAKELFQVDLAGARAMTLALRLAPSARQAYQRMLRDPEGNGKGSLTVTLASDPSGNFRGELRCSVVATNRLLWLLHDASAAERARELLESANAKEKAAAEQLRAVDAMRRAFLLDVSHDLQAPIAAIVGLAELLRTQELDDRERSRVVTQLEMSARDTGAMLRELLDYQRIEDAATPPAQRGGVDVATIVKAAASTVDAQEHVLQLELSPATAHADAAIIERIVINLVRNAVQHTPSGTTIWVRCRREPDGVLLVVEDNGPGIPVGRRSSVFDLFQRGRSRGHSRGLGVGLALVRRFAQLHGGYARVEERTGGGASFHVLLRG